MNSGKGQTLGNNEREGGGGIRVCVRGHRQCDTFNGICIGIYLLGGGLVEKRES